MDILSSINDIIKEVDEETITVFDTETTIKELNFDFYDLYDFLLKLEDEYAIDLCDYDIDIDTSIQEIIDIIEEEVL